MQCKNPTPAAALCRNGGFTFPVTTASSLSDSEHVCQSPTSPTARAWGHFHPNAACCVLAVSATFDTNQPFHHSNRRLDAFPYQRNPKYASSFFFCPVRIRHRLWLELQFAHASSASLANEAWARPDSEWDNFLIPGLGSKTLGIKALTQRRPISSI